MFSLPNKIIACALLTANTFFLTRLATMDYLFLAAYHYFRNTKPVALYKLATRKYVKKFNG